MLAELQGARIRPRVVSEASDDHQWSSGTGARLAHDLETTAGTQDDIAWSQAQGA